MPSALVKLPGMTLLRFLTPTFGWAERMPDPWGVPSPWPLMLADLLMDPQGTVWLSSVTGVSKKSVRAFRDQGVALHEFTDLSPDVVSALEQHFREVVEDVHRRVGEIGEAVLRHGRPFLVQSEPTQP